VAASGVQITTDFDVNLAYSRSGGMSSVPFARPVSTSCSSVAQGGMLVALLAVELLRMSGR
jgi:hypothetical protein